jgi:Polysaccharide deacetylase
VRLLIPLLLLAAACRQPLDEIDEIYSTDPDQRVFCGVDIDDAKGNDLDSILGGLERAHERGEVMHLYAHAPGSSVSNERLEAVLTRADELGLAYLTYAELGAPAPPQGGLALSFDDSNIDAWYGARALFQAHGARVTFFVTRYDWFTDLGRTWLHELAGDRHEIAAHGLRHRNGPNYVIEYGLRAYLDDEVLPSLQLLRDDGFTVTSFAYPYGRRTGEMDHALLQYFERIRSVSYSIEGLVSDPCPE